ncbi:MAG: hypothetical protein KDM63_14100 [Verrucomicrobiae bacterium]|nr:hypothetical protein [Verrucomicrobiae bacterium]
MSSGATGLGVSVAGSCWTWDRFALSFPMPWSGVLHGLSSPSRVRGPANPKEAAGASAPDSVAVDVTLSSRRRYRVDSAADGANWEY